MPLLNRKAFRTDPTPSDLNDNEEIFVCRQTNEVYRDYEAFFKRTILCNSLVWSCEITLKHGLTYEEAAESEEEAREVIQKIPQPIKRGVLTLVHYTRHSRLDNLCDEVFNYIRDRYQEGEEIEVKYKGEKMVGYVHSVIEPKVLTNGFDSRKSKNKVNSSSGKSSKVSKSTSKTNADLIVLSDDEGKDEQSDVKSPPASKKDSPWPDAKTYQYMVKLKPTKSTSSRTPEIITVKQSCINRKKGTFSREKLKLLLRLTCCRSGHKTEPGYWRVKDEYREKYDLSAGVDDALSIVVERKSKKRKRSEANNETKKKMKKDKKMSGQTKKNKVQNNGKAEKAKEDKPKLTPAEIERMKEEFRLKREKEKELKKQERDKARLKRSELLKEQKMFLLHWCVPQDDLDLDDNKDLPMSVPVDSKFSPEMFGDVIMVLEFLFIFGEFFCIKQHFPEGISLDILEDALTEHDAEGSFYDIVRFLLSSILLTHAEEEEDEGLDDIDHEDTMKNTKEQSEDDEDNDITRVKKAVSASAAMAAAWAQLHQGRNLHQLTLDPFTCSEILRLHFLSSGASMVSGGDGDLYRWQRRGGFTVSDDAGVAFRHYEHTIMRSLVTGNIYDLNPVEKLKIIKTLCAQLLTYATTRDIIDDGFDRLRKAKRELQEEQWADQRKDKEEAAAKFRKRIEEKAKEKEEKAKLIEQGKSDGTKVEKSTAQEVKVSLNEDDHEEIKAHTRSQGPVAEQQSNEGEINEEAQRLERKENLKKKEKIFLREIKKGQSMSGVQPVGIDRLFRRYWIFNSLNGLFIEDNDQDLPKLLLPEEPSDEMSYDDSNSDATSVSTEEQQRDSSLTPVIPNPTSSITTLSKDEIEREKDLCRILKLYNIPQDSLPTNCVLNTGESSLKREQICARLNEREIVQWSYLNTKEDLDQLVKSLNPRGYREKYLRESLIASYDTIVKGMENNPFKLENKLRREEMKLQPKVSRNQAVDKTLYKTMEDFIEASIRDQILDLEDRVWQGGLGSVKVSDITIWRKQVENGIYDFMPGNKNPPEKSEDGKQSDDLLSSMKVDEECENMDVDQQSTSISNDIKPKLISRVQNSRPGTPVEGSFALTPTSSQTPQSINPCVRVLAKAVLEVEQGIDRKYLIPPLGEDAETKKRRQQKASDAAKRELNEMMAKKKKEKSGQVNEKDKQQNGKAEEKSKGKAQTILLERWEESLMASTNLAQVCIHLSNLDNCISWDKSVLNARCRICRRKGDAEHMLLCDGCDKGHHIYCLKPPIKEIPEGDWFCSQCRPVEPRRSYRRHKKEDSEGEENERQDMKLLEMNNEDESDDEDTGDDSDDDDDDDDNDDDDDDIDDDIDDEGDDEEGDDDDDDVWDVEENERLSSDNDGSVHMDTCACCDGEGELLCCETCPLVYHIECAYPPLRRIPRGTWVCQVCSGADQDLPSGRRVKKTVIKAGQKYMKEKESSKLSDKKAKIKTKPTQSKQKASKLKSDKRSEEKKPEVSKRQNNSSNSPSTGRNRNTPTVRVNGRRSNTNTPKNSSFSPSGISNSAPTLKPVRWPIALVKKCERLLKELMNHEDASLFLFPVDIAQVPDYTTIVKTPMDLQTIKTKLSNHQYYSVDEFVADIRQIFFNCSEYNKPRTKEARAGIRLSTYFETRFGELGLDSSEQRGPRTRRSR